MSKCIHTACSLLTGTNIKVYLGFQTQTTAPVTLRSTLTHKLHVKKHAPVVSSKLSQSGLVDLLFMSQDPATEFYTQLLITWLFHTWCSISQYITVYYQPLNQTLKFEFISG